MDLDMTSLGTLVPQAPFGVFCHKMSVYWGLTHDMFFASTLIWYDTNKDTQHKQGPTDWHTHTNIYDTTCYVLTTDICITMNE